MRQVLKLVCLLTVLVLAQHGALVHELGHIVSAQVDGASEVHGGADANCTLCPAFAQVVTPAFSHSFHIPVMVLVASQRSSELRIVAIDAAIPHPRSRGPPSLS